MDKWQRIFPWGYRLYNKIAEPRVVRLLHFGIYITLLIAGVGVLVHTPRSFEGVLGVLLVYIFGGFVAIGALLAAFSVLPGIWWLERAGISLLWSGLGLYFLITIGIGASVVTSAIPIGFILTLVLRWREIKRFQLAPIKGG